MLIAGTFVLAVVALHSALGMPGTALPAGALFVIGNAINGSAVPIAMLPDMYRQIAPWLPNNAAIHLIRSDMYFDGHGQSSALLTLTLWIAAAAVIIMLADYFKVVIARRTRSGTVTPRT